MFGAGKSGAISCFKSVSSSFIVFNISSTRYGRLLFRQVIRELVILLLC